jgi:hypothetical protein
MSADLHIHIITRKFTIEHAKAFSSNTLGSKYFCGGDIDNIDLNYRDNFEKKHKCDLHDMAADTPNVWVGEVSWLKAMLFNDSKRFIPDPIQKISDIIGEDFPIIDDKMILKIKKALGIKNQTAYDITSDNKVIIFLEKYKGKKAFTVSW